MTIAIRIRCVLCYTEFSKSISVPLRCAEFVRNIARVRCACGGKTKSLVVVPGDVRAENGREVNV